VNNIDTFAGTFEGSGSWYDSAGKAMAYRISQTNRNDGNSFEIAFKHDFDDGSVVTALFSMIWITPALFRVEVGGASIGNGYFFDNRCHYHIKAGEAFVEANYHLVEDGLEVFGSSSRNAEGNYIAWKETLRRSAV
jgi:hypothetical protein